MDEKAIIEFVYDFYLFIFTLSLFFLAIELKTCKTWLCATAKAETILFSVFILLTVIGGTN
jgi:hypothetical protein